MTTMIKKFIKPEDVIMWSLRKANSNWWWINELRRIVPDLSEQNSIGKEKFNDLWELKIRSLHAFQVKLMCKVLESIKFPSVVDIGDSSGNHMLYLHSLLRSVKTLSVNLDKRAVDKIKAKGLEAMLCRAEDLELDRKFDLAVSFEMVEHLHDPVKFLRKLNCDKLLITVPYLRQSRVGLHNIRNNTNKKVYAEDEHIFELSPEDWTLLFKHAGWKVTHQEIYYQYPRWAKFIMARFWRKIDFEGFWGVLLERDDTYSKLYQDWRP